MSELIIYHNGECTKSNGALELAQEQNIPHTVRWYLADPLSESELKVLLSKLKMCPSELVRKNEDLLLAQYQDKDLSEREWLTILTENPILMQRPIAERGDKAVVARPAEKIFEVVA